MVCKKKNYIEIRYIKEFNDLVENRYLNGENKDKNLSVDDIEYFNYKKAKGYKVGKKGIKQTNIVRLQKEEKKKLNGEKQETKEVVKKKESLKEIIKSTFSMKKVGSLENEETSLEKLEKMVKKEFKVLDEIKEKKIEDKSEKKPTKRTLMKKLKKSLSFKKRKEEEQASEDTAFLLNTDELKVEQSKQIKKSFKNKIGSFFNKLNKTCRNKCTNKNKIINV